MVVGTRTLAHHIKIFVPTDPKSKVVLVICSGQGPCCRLWQPLTVTSAPLRPRPSSDGLILDLITQDLHLITHTTLARSSNAVDSICPTTTKALLPSRLQLTTIAVLARPSTTARHSTSPALLQSLHVAPPAAAVSIYLFSTDTSVPPQPTAMAAGTLLPTLVFLPHCTVLASLAGHVDAVRGSAFR